MQARTFSFVSSWDQVFPVCIYWIGISTLSWSLAGLIVAVMTLAVCFCSEWMSLAPSGRPLFAFGIISVALLSVMGRKVGVLAGFMCEWDDYCSIIK
jgi:hypothetical protein